MLMANLKRSAMNDRDEIPNDEIPNDEAEPIELDGVLDLHMFQPGDVKDLVADWLDECRTAGVLEVRIIHGKGIGVLRTIVQKILSEHPAVLDFGHPNDGGSWGATTARLRSPDKG